MRNRVIAILSAAVPAPAVAASAAAGAEVSAGWLPWVVLGAIALFVGGVVVRMVLAARFPGGYKRWAASRRDAFAERNESWDKADEDFRH